MVAEREVDMHKHWSRSSIVIPVCFSAAVSSQTNISLYLKFICYVMFDYSQSLFYFVPQESHSQAGWWGTDVCRFSTISCLRKSHSQAGSARAGGELR